MKTNRRQTAAEKKQADIQLVRNAITAFENFMAKYPDDPANTHRARQLQQQREKLAGMVG